MEGGGGYVSSDDHQVALRGGGGGVSIAGEYPRSHGTTSTGTET